MASVVAITSARPRMPSSGGRRAAGHQRGDSVAPHPLSEPAETVRFPAPSAAVPEGYAGLAAEAQTLAASIMARYPERSQSTALAATIAAERGELETAASVWRAHLERHPESAEGWYRLGLYAGKEGRDAEAAEWLERARRIDPALPDIQGHLGRCLLKSDRVDEAADVLEPAIGDDRGGAIRLFHLGHARLQQGKIAEARAAFQGAIDRAPSYTGAWYGLATALSRLALADDAERALAEFRRLKAEDAETAARNLSRDEGVRLRRLLAGWYAAAGRIAALEGDTQEAEALWLRGVAVDPAAPDIRRALVDLYRRQGRIGDAENHSFLPPANAAGEGR